ncbi:MAG: hypothetical protein K0S99_563 [Thermomicrobiales bacterium]|nr:hypothetical protein [Thermomicrobiales bacterium]
MSNRPHPTLIISENLFLVRRLFRDRLAADGALCADDQGALERLDGVHALASDYAKRRALADAFERAGDTPYVRRLLAETTGLRVAMSGYDTVDAAERSANPR